jgi:hypothetical protein
VVSVVGITDCGEMLHLVGGGQSEEQLEKESLTHIPVKWVASSGNITSLQVFHQ